MAASETDELIALESLLLEAIFLWLCRWLLLDQFPSLILAGSFDDFLRAPSMKKVKETCICFGGSEERHDSKAENEDGEFRAHCSFCNS